MSNFIQLNLAWKTIKWPLVKDRIRRVQRRIYKARRNGNIDKAHWLQKLLINSFDAKLLAVQQVTTLNQGKKTAGVDGIRGLTDKQKIALARSLRLDGKASSIRRVWISKPGKTEKRPLGIPTIRDRAKQALAKYALEPEWEAVFEPNSYGFRPARSAHDAIEAIFLGLRHGVPKWIFDADIRKCFDRIDHDALISKLNTFPEMEEQILAWLKADIMAGYAKNPKDIQLSTRGTPQGGIVSPLLANIALHGLENHLKNFVTNLPSPRIGANRGKAAKQKALTIVRYADDFVLIHENLAILEACKEETSRWLTGIGLELSKEKSALRDGRKGFRFLGFRIIQVRKNKDYKVKIFPHKENKKVLLDKVGKVIQLNKASSAYKLIRTLRPIIIGWANYYKYCECKTTFHKLTDSIFRCVRAWVFRRDTRNGRKAIKEKYFPSGKTYTFQGIKHRDNWILVGKTQFRKKGKTQETFLPHIVWVPSEKFVKVKGDASPYNGDYMYWGLRLKKYQTLSVRVKQLLKRQEMRCTLCKQPFVSFDRLEVDHIIPLHMDGAAFHADGTKFRKDSYDNIQLLHRHCHIRKTAGDLNLRVPLQEPDEAKVSRPDLKTRLGRNT
jgi:RNA-directed DNA polymerase